MKKYYFLLLLSINLFSLNGNTFLTQTRMLNDLEFIKNVFDVKYAPKSWKYDFCNWDLTNEYQKAQAEVSSCFTLKDYHRALKRFFNSARDYHVGITFYSTEWARLPFTVKGASGRYFVVHVNREGLAGVFENLFGTKVEEKDEILEFDGQSVGSVIEKLMEEDLGSNTFETQMALAELLLTNRSGKRGEIVPKGNIDIKVRKPTGEVIVYTYLWEHNPEKIGNAPLLKTTCALSFQNDNVFQKRDVAPFLDKMMVSPLVQTMVSSHRSENKYEIGNRVSYVPKLGKKIWESDEKCSFHAYIFSMPTTSSQSQKKVGYIRIPTYHAGQDEAEEFSEIISQFQWKTDALVIDQINNPGGSALYLYALASMLTQEPMPAPKHHILLTQAEIYNAQKLLESLDEVKDDNQAKEVLGQNMGGYPIDYRFAALLKRFCNFICDEWKEGHLYTNLTHLFGIDSINPHPRAHYTKPILLLTNSLDFSGADFFPAILQDNKRATILGTRTAGAGGYVITISFPNRNGIASFHITGSFAERMNNKPIENIGVIPDIFYEATPQDLTENHVGYANAILKALEGILKGGA